ncbi:ATP-binding protein [Odoribacter sp. OttesenSCG-928-L07]|nr:ATP-binding protein [Odoribacter sp. OttesenSCG-928-L07]MDL2239661.1 ATP-binding protein [Bacteroidales bacterium OttesenSCG-928-L14]MDL2240354.1 ATP-binding protein [Bacteroidales bacterium OttesenSCG-928-K22]
MIHRKLENNIHERLFTGKAIIIMGARQVGKTTMIKELFNNSPEMIWLNGDDPDVQMLFENITSSRLISILGSKKYVVIDEAQRINDVGVKLKLITDQIPEIQLIATGSASFDLSNKINEPLTGRKWEYTMYPISFEEMVLHHGLLEEKRLIPHRLVFGYYPDVINNPGDEREILRQLSDSYLYKDVLMWERIKKSEKLIKLLQAIAYQVGSQVSYNELGQICGLDTKTIEKYIVLLEQCFIIFRLYSFSRNMRDELKHSKKIYFYDNGIRNALISNFSILETRNDIGALWENFLISERQKKLEYDEMIRHSWFWRTTSQKEIDYIEEGDGKIQAYEFKWNPDAKYKEPKQFLENYPNSSFEIIHRNNFEDFLL